MNGPSQKGDLRRPGLIWLKAGLLLLIGVAAGGLVWLEAPGIRNAILIVLCVWAFCRAYYFAFYVIERYLDPGFRFAGLISVARYLWRRRK